MKKSGTAVLLVVLVASILITGVTVLWRSAAQSFESAMHYYRARKNFYACESLALYGAALFKSNLILSDNLPLNNKSALLYKGAWPKGSQNWGELVVSYDRKTEQIDLLAKLFSNMHLEPIAITRILLKKANKSFQVLSWKNA